jgi:DNA invertase Pin-like site-specific DNA recombinase
MSSRKSQAERRIEELLSKLNKGDSLIVTETSRLGRSTGEVLMLIDDLVEKGITIIVTKKDEVINKENRNKLTANLTLHALFAELERDIISQRTKEALAYRKEQGQPIGRPAGEPTKSIYDDKLEDIKDLLAKDVPLNVISRILAVGKPLSLRRFLMKKNLLVYKRIRVKPGTRK